MRERGCMREREGEHQINKLVNSCVCKNLLCVCYRLTSKAQRRQCQSQPRIQRRKYLELDAKCAPPMNTFIISYHRLHSSFL